MQTLTVIFIVLVFVFYIIIYIKNPPLATKGFLIGGRAFVKMLPLIIAAFAMMGIIQAIIPREFFSRWLGSKAGFKGIFIGTLLGAITPGPLYFTFPIASGLLKGGASIGTVVAYLIAWEVWSIRRIPLEVSFMGWKFMMVKLTIALILPPIAGLLAEFAFKKFVF